MVLRLISIAFLCAGFMFSSLHADAVSLFAQAPDSCKTVLSKKMEKIYQEGISYFRRGNYPLAAQQMRQVVNEEPGCVDALYVLGLINFKKQDRNFKEAEKYFRAVVALCPDYDNYAFLYLAEISYSKEDFREVIKNLKIFTRDVDKIKKDEDYNRAIELLDYAEFYVTLTGNPVPFEPKVVEGISTAENEYLPILSPDNQMAFFTRETRINPDRNSLVKEVRYKEKFYFSLKSEDGSFGEGEEMPEPFNLQDNEGGATLTADNRMLYYTVCKYNNLRDYLNCDIYYSENIQGEWTPIKSVGNKINSPGSWESQPTVSADGRILYFVSDRNGGYGGYDIYKSIRGADGAWSAPINLGPVINSKAHEKSPFLHPDGKTLYFSSDGHKGLGGYDIFFSRSDSTGSWSKPKNIGYPINSPDDELGFFVSTDGTLGFFSSNKYNGKGGWDLYSFELYDAARPEKVLFIRGTVKSEISAEPVKAHIELKNIESRNISEVPMDSLTGNYVAVAPFNSDYIMTVKKEGHVYETKYISKVDSVYKMLARVDVDVKPIELNKSYRINDIYFAFNSYRLNDTSKVVLDQLIDFLNENKTISIEIQGHTDNIGNKTSNHILSENRARAVYDYIIEKGIGVSRLSSNGYGASKPVADNNSEEGRAKNRRTVFVITKK